MSLIVVGSVALDSVETSAGKTKNSLGGAAVYSSVVSSNYTSTKLVGVIGEDFPKEYIELLKSKNIDLEGLIKEKGKTFRWSGVYKDLNQAITLDTQLNVFANFNPILPASYLQSNFLFLGNIHPALQLKVLEQMNPKISAVDTMNFWISGEKELLTEVFKKVDIIFINDEEIKQFTEMDNIFQAAQSLLKLGPKLVVVKRGEFGAVAIGNGKFTFFTPGFPVNKVVDPTGAGDSFAGGFMGYLSSKGMYNNKIVKEAMLNGTICASYCIQGFSLDKIKEIKSVNIDSKISDLIEFISV
ncbi:MAG: PfkB family carbohydrate kinase [Candidatus Cloacimonadota bacterium]|nr:PfkB family carbohydrate kinase [Candidatus Cloacimonadota bacterium]